MARITNISESLARHILGQYRMSPQQIDATLDQARQAGAYEGKHNGSPITVIAEYRGSRFTIIR